jgi:hypothetical protein
MARADRAARVAKGQRRIVARRLDQCTRGASRASIGPLGRKSTDTMVEASVLGPRETPSSARDAGRALPSGITELFCGERWDRVGDGFGSRANNFDSVVTTESASSNRGFGEVGSSVHKACGWTSKPDGHAHHGRCIVAGAIANIRRCRRRADKDESRQHRWVTGVMKIR